MTTGTTLTEKARRKIGAFSPIAPSGNDASIEAFDALRGLMQEWLSDNIEIGVSPLKDIGDDLEEPLDTTNAIINNLAILLAPDFEDGKPNVSASLAANARSGYAGVYGRYWTDTIPDKVVSSTLPKGAGNDQFFRTRIFVGKGATVPSSNG